MTNFLSGHRICERERAKHRNDRGLLGCNDDNGRTNDERGNHVDGPTDSQQTRLLSAGLLDLYRTLMSIPMLDGQQVTTAPEPPPYRTFQLGQAGQ
jgi:hypothetical protein